jgi:hypothetical protein
LLYKYPQTNFFFISFLERKETQAEIGSQRKKRQNKDKENIDFGAALLKFGEDLKTGEIIYIDD